MDQSLLPGRQHYNGYMKILHVTGAVLFLASIIFMLSLFNTDIATSDVGLASLLYALLQAVLFGWFYGTVCSIFKARNIDFISTLRIPAGGAEPFDRTTDGKFPFFADRSRFGTTVHDFIRVFTLSSEISILLAVFVVLYGAAQFVDVAYLVQTIGLFLIIISLFFFVVPYSWPEPSTRLSLGALLGQCFVAIVWPIFGVSFVHILAADALTSTTTLLTQYATGVCYYVTGEFVRPNVSKCGSGTPFVKIVIPLITALPFWIRSIQVLFKVVECRNKAMPTSAHWVNFGKYVSCIVVVVLSALANYLPGKSYDGRSMYTWAWIASLIVKTVYCTSWDIFQDFDLGHMKHNFLREKLLLPKWVYYFVMITNFILRCTWSAALSIDLLPKNWTEILALLEIYRRSQWILIRVENEYLRTSKYSIQ